MSKRALCGLSFLLLLPAIAVVAAPPSSPNIGAPSISPSSPGPNDQVTVTVTVTAGPVGVQNVTVHYTTDAWKTTNTTLVAYYNMSSQIATAQIPPLYNGGHVEYYIMAFDWNNNRAINNNNGSYFSYTVPTPPPSTTTNMWIELTIVIVAVGAAASVAFYSIRPKTKPDTN